MKGLIIKRQWLDLIFAGKKIWEIRGCNTKTRGKIALIQSGSGLIVGECELVGSKQLSLFDYQNNVDKHQVINTFTLPYTKTFAWVLQNAKKYDNPKPYKHKCGAVIWVNLD